MPTSPEAELASPPLHAFQKPPGDALCCPVLEQLVLQKLPLNKVCALHVQKFLRRVHPTAVMIKQLSFSRNRHSTIVEHCGPYLEVSGATLGQLTWDIITKKHVLRYTSHAKRYLFYRWDGKPLFFVDN